VDLGERDRGDVAVGGTFDGVDVRLDGVAPRFVTATSGSASKTTGSGTSVTIGLPVVGVSAAEALEVLLVAAPLVP
jgi:hypothetical protein